MTGDERKAPKKSRAESERCRVKGDGPPTNGPDGEITGAGTKPGRGNGGADVPATKNTPAAGGNGGEDLPDLSATAAGPDRGNGETRFPDSLDERRILDERAALLARQNNNDGETAEREPFIQFRLGPSEHYGVPHRHAEAVMPRADMAPVPCTPAFVAGVVNRRGRLLTVLDLKKFFDTGADGYGDEAQIIVINAGGISVGVLADAVETDGAFDPASLAPTLPSPGVANLDYVKGLYDGRIAILDVEALLADPALNVNETTD